MYYPKMARGLYSSKNRALRKALVKARETSDLTQEDIAEKLSRPQSFVSKYENGERRIDAVEFLEICKLLKADYVSILKEIENTN